MKVFAPLAWFLGYALSYAEKKTNMPCKRGGKGRRRKNNCFMAREKRKNIVFLCETVYFFLSFVYNTSMRIWAKLMTDGKIRKQFVYENPETLTYSRFFDYLIDICQALDIPTPVLTKTHIFNFAKFNHVKFVGRDFVESLGYDHLFLENIL